MTELGNLLRERRKELSLTMNQIQELSGIPQPSLSSYERGKKMPGGKMVERLSEAYDVPVDELNALISLEEVEKEPLSVTTTGKVKVKVTKFTCNNEHFFFVPIENTYENLAEFAIMINEIQCPICHCGSDSIRMNPQEYIVS